MSSRSDTLIPALVVSGLPTDRFTFEGFLPSKKGRKKRLNELLNEKRTMIFYESPHKINKTLKDFERNCLLQNLRHYRRH